MLIFDKQMDVCQLPRPQKSWFVTGNGDETSLKVMTMTSKFFLLILFTFLLTFALNTRKPNKLTSENSMNSDCSTLQHITETQ